MTTWDDRMRPVAARPRGRARPTGENLTATPALQRIYLGNVACHIYSTLDDEEVIARAVWGAVAAETLSVAVSAISNSGRRKPSSGAGSRPHLDVDSIPGSNPGGASKITE